MSSMTNDYLTLLHGYAKHYLSLGLTVIRLQPQSKVAADKWKSEKITLANLKEKLNAPYNIAIRLGAESGFLIVFDFDNFKSFEQFYLILQDYGRLDLLDTWVAKTGKGIHVYYFIDWKDDNASELLSPIPLGKYFSNLEIRGEGNYVVAPPSIHPSGAQYEFLQGPYMPIKTIGSKEYATLLYLYTKTGDVDIVKFEELYEKLRRISPSVFEIEFTTPHEHDEVKKPIVHVRAELKVTANTKKIYELVKPLLPYLPRQEFSLTLFTTLARLGLHPLKAVEVLAFLLSDNEYIRRRSASDSNEIQEAKRRVQVFSYAYDNVWRTLRGHPLEAEFPGIFNELLARLKSLLKDHPISQYLSEDWFLKGSGAHSLRGLPTLTNMLASALVKLSKAKGEHITLAQAKDAAWFIAKEIAEICRPERKTPTELRRKLQIYQIASEKVQVIGPGKSFSGAYINIHDMWVKKFPEKKEEFPLFKKVTIPIIYQDKKGVIRKGAKILYYFKNGDEWERFRVEYTEGQPLTAKPVEILRATFFKGVAYVKLYVEGELFENAVNVVVDQLVKAGITTSYEKEYLRKYFTWVSQTHKGEAFLAPGIYEVDGKFVAALPNTTEHLLPSSPLAEENITILKEWASKISEEEYKAFLETIIDYKEFLPPTVYYAAMSYMGIAGFLSAIVDITGIKPALYILGRGAGTGKTHLATFIAVLGYGSSVWSQTAIKSDFRFDELFSSTTFALLFDDVDKYGSQTLKNLKTVLTARARTFRGKGIGAVKFYELAAVPVFTANEPVKEFFEDQALTDRLITLKLTRPLTPEEKMNYRVRIDLKAGVSKNKVYAPLFVKELVEIANKLGGKRWMETRYDYWFQEAVNLGIVDGRDPQKFATLMIGAELLSALLHKYGLTFEVEKAKEEIAKVFLNQEKDLPLELEDTIYAIHLKGLALEREDGWVVTGNLLATLRADPAFRGEGWHIPRKPKELAEILYGLGYTKDKVGPKSFAVGRSYPYGVLIPVELLAKVLDLKTAEGEEEVTPQDLEKLVMWVNGHTFDEMLQVTGWKERKLTKALIELEKMGVIYAKDGKYFVDAKKAHEKGFPIIGPGGDEYE